MGFYKVGDEMPIDRYFDSDGEEQVCPNCDKPLTSVAFKDNGDVGLLCACEQSDLLEPNDAQ